MAMDKGGKVKMKMHLYMQTMVEVVNPASGHTSELLSARIGVRDIHLQNQRRILSRIVDIAGGKEQPRYKLRCLYGLLKGYVRHPQW